MEATTATTLAEAKKFLGDNLTKGVKCPCCSRHTQIYSRKITSSMAYGLIELYKLHKLGGEFMWTHIENSFKILNLPSSVRGDVPKLRFWGLIEPRTEESEDGNPNSGFYRLTSAGIAFAENELKIESKILIYNNEMYGYAKDSELISIKQALKDKFNYNQLMGHENV